MNRFYQNGKQTSQNKNATLQSPQIESLLWEFNLMSWKANNLMDELKLHRQVSP